jgi:uncharacterized protein (DUF983 family)
MEPHPCPLDQIIDKTTMTTTRPAKDNLWRRFIAILLQRCPRCLHGHVYHGLMSMHDACPECGHQFGREPGYFTGAMYASYTMAVPLLFIIFVVLWSLFSSTWTLMFNLLATFIVFLPFVPIIYRFSRVIWMHADWKLDPGKRL